MKFITSFSITVIIFHCQFLKAQNTTELSASVDHLITKQLRAFVKNKEINSVSVGVFSNGIVKTYHYGELEKGKQNTPNDTTLYEIASVTKTMTGYLIAKAEQEGKINLENDIRKYLDEPYPNLEFKGEPIRIKHLITHTSTLGHFMSGDMSRAFETLDKKVPHRFYEAENNYSKEKFFNDLHKVTLTETPGSKYSYSNAGAELIGHILEKVYHKDINQLLKEEFFQKFSMHNTGIRLTKQQEKNLIKGYWMSNNTPSPNFTNPLWGTGSAVKSNVSDMLQYIKLHLTPENKISLKSKEVLYQEGKTLRIGYFWRVWKDKYGTSYNHHGGTWGVQNWTYIFPKYNFGIFIITNQSSVKTAGKLNKVVKKIIQKVSEQKL